MHTPACHHRDRRQVPVDRRDDPPGYRVAAGREPGRRDPQHQEAAALQALAAPPPDQLHSGLLPGLEGQAGQRGWLVMVTS